MILYCGEKFRSRASLRADQEVAAARGGALAAADPGRAGGAPPPGGPGPGQQPVLQRAAGQPAGHAAGHQAVRADEISLALASDERLAGVGFVEAVIIGSSQILALLAGISRDGVTMVTGMARGLSREDAARFAFLLATPVILAAGALKIPDLAGPLGHGIRGQILLGSVLSGLGAYVSVRFLVRYFQTRTLYPFAIYCFALGLLSVIYLGVIK
jgi:undecaprenyl-diphosphatase